MKPLSPFKFFIENKKNTALISIILILSMAVVSFITSLVTSIILDAENANLKSYENFSVVYKTNEELFLKDSVVAEVTAYPEIKKSMNVMVTNTYFLSLMGSTSAAVYFIEDPAELKYVADISKLSILEGRLPQDNDEFEIALHNSLLKNKNLSVGDYVGNDVQDDEWLPGKYRIVGSLKGEALIGFGNKSVLSQAYKEQGLPDKPMALLLIPKDGELNALNQRLEELDRNEASTANYTSFRRAIDNQTASMNVLLQIVIFIVVFILSISVGALVYIIYLGRSDEFGILYAMGYGRKFVKRKIIKEISALAIVCWFIGYLLSFIMINSINFLILAQKGQHLYFFTLTGFINTLFIPVMVLICSSYPILKKLKKWDPIAVIERRE